MRGALALLAACAACGRIDFAERARSDGGTTMGSSDGSDATPPCTFGPFGAPTQVAGINSASDDWSVSLSGDQLVAFISSFRSGGAQIFEARRGDPTQAFQTPTLITEITAGASDQTPVTSFDGLTLLVTSNRIGSIGSYDLFAFTRPDLNTPFTAGPSMAALNSVSYDSRGWMSQDGLRIYYSSQRSGNHEIYVAQRSSPAVAFGAPVLIPELNTTADDFGPALSLDELEVYFTSTRAGGLGSEDVWYATRSATTQPFGTPQNLGVVNSTRDDVSPWLSADGKSLYLNHDALELGGANADIWVSTRACL